MGLAFFSEQGRRVASTTSAPIVGGPYYGRPYWPRGQSGQRVHFVKDSGGLPMVAGALCGHTTDATNLCANPRFEAGTTGWSNVTRLQYGGMWGGGGCGYTFDQNRAAADLDGYYTYDKGSGIGTASVFFSVWARICSLDSPGYLDTGSVSAKVRIEDNTAATIWKTTAYRKLYASDGWVLLSIMITNTAWVGNILKCGLEFQTTATGRSIYVALDGAFLSVGTTDALNYRGFAYHDGSFPQSAWSGATDASTSTVSSARYLTYPLTDVPWSTREGFLSAFCFIPTSPLLADWPVPAVSGNHHHFLLDIEELSKFNCYAYFSKRPSADGWTLTFAHRFAELDLDLTGWPMCPMHVILSWTDAGLFCGVRGYFDPAKYGLTSNIVTGTFYPDPQRFVEPASSISLIVGNSSLLSAANAFEGYIWDLNIGNRGLGVAEIQGILQHGPGPYTGTVAWAPLDAGTALLLVDAVSFHGGGPLGLARASYAPQSGLVAVAGSGRPASDLTRAVTENVIDSFSIVGRLKDVQLTQRAISALSSLFEQVHRNNEQGARYSAGVAFSMDTLQPGHPTLRTFPAPKRLLSRLVWGNIELDARLTSHYGKRGVIWGTVKFERWGFWQGPQTRVMLAKDGASAPALTYTTDNFNNASGTSDAHYFEVPEGLVEGDLEAACQMYFRSPVSSVLSRIRLARRSRGIPGDVIACYEGESATNTFGGTGGTVVAAAQSGGNVRSSTATGAAFFDWIKFQIVNEDSAIPDWLFGEWRILAVVSPQIGGTDLLSLRARVDMGGGFTGAYGPTVGTGITTGTEYHVLDLGIFKLPPASIPKNLGTVGGSAQGVAVTLQVKCPVGSWDIYCDCIMLMPADEMYVQVDRNGSDVAVGSGSLLVSSTEGQEQAVMLDASDRFEDIAILRARGVYVQPLRKNRFWLLIDKWVSTRYDSDPAGGATVELYYTPRYLLLPSYEGGSGGSWA